jgi:hypothetical protein
VLDPRKVAGLAEHLGDLPTGLGLSQHVAHELLLGRTVGGEVERQLTRDESTEFGIVAGRSLVFLLECR